MASTAIGIAFISDKAAPGTLAQRDSLRALIRGWGTGQTDRRARRLWQFTKRFKYLHSATFGYSPTRITVAINGNISQAWSNALVLDQNLQGRDLQLVFTHEWGHIYDEFMLTPGMRQVFMDHIGHSGGWRDGDYWSRPNELFAWSFQRLFFPELGDFAYPRSLLEATLPDPDPEWLAAGFEIN